MDLEIIHRDDSIVVVNKPAGLLAVPGRGPDKRDCVVARVRTLFPAMIRQPAVHRLDMQTSGLMVLAIDEHARTTLGRHFQTRRVVKLYEAVVFGRIAGKSGIIRLPFRLDPDHRPYQIYDPINGRESVTLWKRISDHALGTRIEFIPLTGRTHQLRVHSAHPLGLGAPIVGDALYGSGRDGERMLLHAASLSFNHPRDGRIVEFHCRPPF
jgi:tRNA pseudouridine32 synthase/23S rRNA pseudouridine746 synthase